MPITQIMFIRTPWNGSSVDPNGNWSKIDYICSTALASSAEKFDHVSQSDHAPIGCHIAAPHTSKTKKTAWRVDKRLSTKDLALTLLESAWPLKQMNRDPALKQAMIKVTLANKETNVVKRILSAVNDPLISLDQF